MKLPHMQALLISSVFVALLGTTAQTVHAEPARDGFYGSLILGQAFMPNITVPQNTQMAQNYLGCSNGVLQPILSILNQDAVGVSGGCSGLDCFYNTLAERLPPLYIDPDLPAANPRPTFSYDEFVFELGFNLGANIGYKYNNIRLELEGLWNRFDNQRLTTNGDKNAIAGTSMPVSADPASTSTVSISLREGVGGTTQIKAGMLNLYYDFDSYADRDNSNDIIPFVGVGVGRGNIRRNVKLCNNIDPTTQLQTTLRLLETDSRNAAQFIVGIQYNADTLTTFAVDYRYFTTTGATLSGLFNSSKKSTVSPTLLFGSEYIAHSFNLTMTHHFVDDGNLIL